MSKGPTVTLTFAGDSSKLDETFDKVGKSASKMSGKVDDASGHIQGGTDHLGRFSDAADNADTKGQGFADTIGGLGDVFTGLTDSSASLPEKLMLIGGGISDLASGFVDFLIPTIATFATTLWGTVIPAVWGFTTALLANPITWIVLGIIALIAVIVLLVTHFDTVKRVVGVVVKWISDKWHAVTSTLSGLATNIKNAFVGAFDWVKNHVAGVIDWFAKLPGRIGGFFSSIGRGIMNAFRGAFNFVADIWNSTIGSIGFTVPSWVPFIGGNHFGVPKIPKFHTGGVVPGSPGSEMLAVLQAGERVTPANKVNQDGSKTVTFAGDLDSAFATFFMHLVRTGQIQVA